MIQVCLLPGSQVEIVIHITKHSDFEFHIEYDMFVTLSNDEMVQANTMPGEIQPLSVDLSIEAIFLAKTVDASTPFRGFALRLLCFLH